MIWPSWELILKDRETGKAVWLVKGECGWVALIIRQILPDEAHCQLLKSCDHACPQLSDSLQNHGFNKVSLTKPDGRIQWFLTGAPAQ